MILVCVALWDDGDDLLAEQRAPYPHAREVLALRAADAHAGVLFASYARTAELQSWLERRLAPRDRRGSGLGTACGTASEGRPPTPTLRCSGTQQHARLGCRTRCST